VSGRMEHCGAIQEAWNVAGRCNASQDAQGAWDAENTSLASGRNADGSDAGSVFADELQAAEGEETPMMTRKDVEGSQMRIGEEGGTRDPHPR